MVVLLVLVLLVTPSSLLTVGAYPTDQDTMLMLDILPHIVYNKEATMALPIERMTLKATGSWDSPGAQRTMKLARRKKAMMSLYGLATKGPNHHKTESELQYPPPKDSFISLRGKRQLEEESGGSLAAISWENEAQLNTIEEES